MTAQHPDPLTDLVEAAARRISPPPTDVGADLARGRARVRRRRASIAGVGFAASVVALAGVAVALPHGSGAGHDRVAVDPADGGPSSSTDPTGTSTPSMSATLTSSSEDPRDAKQYLADGRDVVASYLDPGGRHLQRAVTGYQSTLTGLGTKLGWTTAGEPGEAVVEFFVSSGFRDQFEWFCGTRGTTCRDFTVGRGDDAIHAVFEDTEGGAWVAVRHDDGTVVALHTDALFGNDSLTPVAGFDVSDDDLARVAADPRFTAPTAKQVACANTAFGFPDDDATGPGAGLNPNPLAKHC